MQILKKVVVAIFIALLLVVSVHRAVAAPALVELPIFQSEGKGVLHVTCENLKEKAVAFQKQVETSGAALSEYMALVASGYSQWHLTLSALEGREASWPTGFFDPVSNSVDSMDSASDAVYGISSRDEESVHVLRSQIEACFEDTVERDFLLLELENFMLMNTEHLSSVADFLAQMRGRLRDQLVIWRGFEGSEGRIPNDFFTGLRSDADIFSESWSLVRENSQFVEARLLKWVEILSLAPMRPTR